MSLNWKEKILDVIHIDILWIWGERSLSLEATNEINIIFGIVALKKKKKVQRYDWLATTTSPLSIILKVTTYNASDL